MMTSSRGRVQQMPAVTTLAGALAAILLVASSPSMAQAAYMDPGKTGNPDSWKSAEFSADWGLEAIGAEYAYARGLNGAGINVGIMDNGVAGWHEDLQGRVKGITTHDEGCDSGEVIAGPSACFYSDGSETFTYTEPMTQQQVDALQHQAETDPSAQRKLDYLRSLEGYKYGTHGTHVAGSIAASRNGMGSHGVAFASVLHSTQFSSDVYQNVQGLMGQEGGIYATQQPGSEPLKAMFAEMERRGVRVMNNSWGFGTEPRTAAEMDAMALKEAQLITDYSAWAKKTDAIQVWAAGNNSGDIAGFLATIPRYDKDAEPYWLSVTNLGKEGGLAKSSSICGLSMAWCITAPGTAITSTVPTGAVKGELITYEDNSVAGFEITHADRQSGYQDLTGTSMASPHVTGGMALLFQRYPYLTSAQVRDVLLTTAKDLGQPGVDEIYGWGLMDLKKAIDGPGQMRVDTEVKMDVRAGGAKVWEGDAWDDWSNDIGGTGKLSKSGQGWLRLSGNNTFGGAVVKHGVLELSGSNALTGDVQVLGGELLLNGSLQRTRLDVRSGIATVQGQVAQAETNIAAGGRLQGTGVLSDTRVAGTIAPGVAGIGTLTVNGTYTQQAGSVYEVDVQSGGRSDRVDVHGKAVLEGGQVRVSNANLGESFRIVTAQEVSGTFADAEMTSNRPFLSLDLKYTPQQVSVEVARGQSLASAAHTSNQLGVAMAADASSDQDVVVQRLTQLDVPQALAAFDRLSAETHASQRAVWVEQGNDLNQAAVQRLRSVQDAFVQQAEGHNGVWVDAQARGGHLDGDGNAARVNYQGSGLTVGYDRRFGADWTLGVLGATGKGEMRVSERGASHAEDDARALGVYAGKQWGALGLRGGWLMSDHRTDANRQVAYGTFNERQHARYTSEGQQGFIEAGYAWQIGEQLMLEPYAQWSHVRVSTPQFQEQGGLTALQVQADSSQVDFATAGLRFAADLAQGGGQDWLQLGGSLAYRHAQGDLRSIATASWQGGADFSSWSAPLSEQATLLNLNLGARLSAHTLLQLGYDGQFATDAHDHAVNARFSLQF